MPELVIPRDELNAVDLPPVCVVTGATEGVRFIPVRYRASSSWWLLAGLLLFVPVIGFLLLVLAAIASAFLKRTVRGELPFTEAGWALASRGHLQRVVVYALTMVSAAGLPIALLRDSDGRWPVYLALAGLGAGILGIPLVAVTSGRNRVWVKRISSRLIVLHVPSKEAVDAFQRRMHFWSPEDRDSWATRPAGESHACAQHPTVQARWICGRCGGFACDECLRRARPQAMPLCETCFMRRPAGASVSSAA